MLKKLLTLLLLFVTVDAAQAASTDTLVVRIKAMRCEDCAHKVTLALNGKPGVEGLQFDLEKRTVAVAEPRIVNSLVPSVKTHPGITLSPAVRL